VVAGDHRHAVGRAQILEPLARRLVFGGQAEIDQVAGDGDVVRPVRQHVGDNEIERRALVSVTAAALPVEAAGRVSIQMAQRMPGGGARWTSDNGQA
jgi:hypothetical protein